jgi:AAHS family 4-hydroxybenzoate transporter-like MFS transporter
MSSSPQTKPVDIGTLLDEGRWSPYLKFLVFLAALAIIFDGIDNQLLAVSIPSMMKEWNLPRSAFANVLATGMIGMMIGGALAGFVGDRLGRKVALLASVVVFGIMSMAIAAANGVFSLGLLRFLAGIGLGGAMPNAAALASEYVPRRQRPFAVTLTIVCVPLGAMLAAYLAGLIIPVWGWRNLFLAGGAVPLLALVLFVPFLAESPRYLSRHPARWPQLAAFLGRAGHPVAADSTFADSTERPVEKVSATALLTADFRRDTLALWVAFFSCMLSVYAGFNWITALLNGAGWGPRATDGLFYFNLGGVAGAIAAGLLIARFGSKNVMLCLGAGSAACALVLAKMTINAQSITPVLVMLTLTGGLINAVTTMLYALSAHVYPTAVRATGVGTAVAFGRFGAVLSANVGSIMMDKGGSMYFFTMMAAAVAVTFVSLLVVQRHVVHRAA